MGQALFDWLVVHQATIVAALAFVVAGIGCVLWFWSQSGWLDRLQLTGEWQFDRFDAGGRHADLRHIERHLVERDLMREVKLAARTVAFEPPQVVAFVVAGAPLGKEVAEQLQREVEAHFDFDLWSAQIVSVDRLPPAADGSSPLDHPFSKVVRPSQQRFETMLRRQRLNLRIGLAVVLLAATFVTYALVDWAEPVPRTAGLAFPSPLCQKAVRRGVVVFLHGWNGESIATWQKFPHLACADPRLQDMDVLSVDYPTYMARRGLRVPQLAVWLHESIEARAAPRADEPLLVVAHSMGGLVARELAFVRLLANAPARVTRVVSVGTPYAGANIAQLSGYVGLSRELNEDMAPASSFLAGLHARWSVTVSRPPTHCFSSPHDKVVPSESALSRCTREHNFTQWGHKELVKPIDAEDDRYVLPMRALLTAD